MSDLPSQDLAIHLARKVWQMGGEDLRVLHLDAADSLFDYAILATGRSDRQTRSIAAEAYHFCKRHGIERLPVEGGSGWQVLDCYSVVLHVLMEEERAYYELEKLWPGATVVDHEAAFARLPDPDDADDQHASA